MMHWELTDLQSAVSPGHDDRKPSQTKCHQRERFVLGCDRWPPDCGRCNPFFLVLVGRGDRNDNDSRAVAEGNAKDETEKRSLIVLSFKVALVRLERLKSESVSLRRRVTVAAHRSHARNERLGRTAVESALIHEYELFKLITGRGAHVGLCFITHRAT